MTTCPLILLATAFEVALTVAASAGDAPFDFSWGPVAEVPRPSMVDREANLTGLYYLHDRPLASGPATYEVLLVVCREEGLQQVVWVSRPLQADEFATVREGLRREGERRHGPAEPGAVPDALEWPAARISLATRTMTDGARELVMTATGPGYTTCSEAHRVATGHEADLHVTELLRGGR